MKNILDYLKWLLNDGTYVVIEGKHCGLCGAWYEVDYKIMKPSYLYSIGDDWGMCPTCARMKEYK